MRLAKLLNTTKSCTDAGNRTENQNAKQVKIIAQALNEIHDLLHTHDLLLGGMICVVKVGIAPAFQLSAVSLCGYTQRAHPRLLDILCRCSV